MDNKWNELLDKWKDLTSKGNVQESSEFYYEYLFDQVINNFTNKFSTSRQSETLISLLGFSPEPIILTARALNPESHYILTTKNIEDTDLIDRYLPGHSSRKDLDNEDFKTIYNALNEIVVDQQSRNITIDITGGKKSMVAAASIFARDFGAQLVYVDFTTYIEDIRKPEPGTEQLVQVYHPEILADQLSTEN